MSDKKVKPAVENENKEVKGVQPKSFPNRIINTHIGPIDILGNIGKNHSI